MFLLVFDVGRRLGLSSFFRLVFLPLLTRSSLSLMRIHPVFNVNRAITFGRAWSAGDGFLATAPNSAAASAGESGDHLSCFFPFFFAPALGLLRPCFPELETLFERTRHGGSLGT